MACELLLFLYASALAVFIPEYIEKESVFVRNIFPLDEGMQRQRFTIAASFAVVCVFSITATSCTAEHEHSSSFLKNTSCEPLEDESVEDAGVTVQEAKGISSQIGNYPLFLDCLRPYLAREFIVEYSLREVAFAINRQIDSSRGRWKMESALPYDQQNGFGSITLAEQNFLDAYDAFKRNTNRSRPLYRCSKANLTTLENFHSMVVRLLSVGISLKSPGEDLYSPEEIESAQTLRKAMSAHANFEPNVSGGSIARRAADFLNSTIAARDR